MDKETDKKKKTITKKSGLTHSPEKSRSTLTLGLIGRS
jgi:hypothetical protein